MLTLLFASAAALNSPTWTRREGLQTAALAAGGSALLTSTPALAAVSYAQQPGVNLNTGVNFPTCSFGLQIYDDEAARKLTLTALELGYRNFFASVLARNQRGFAKAIKESGVPREDLFICGSVLSNQVRGYDSAYQLSKQGCQENMEAFAVGGIDYIDMIMLDYPGPDDDSIRGQWKALEEMKATRSIAVSNFSPSQLDALSGMTKPTVNQLPYGVGFSRNYGGSGGMERVVAENKKRGVIVQAWSPLRRCLKGPAGEACAAIGEKYGKSAAQVGLRYIADTGATFTTQTRNPSHFKEDINIFDFSLTKEEVAQLAAF